MLGGGAGALTPGAKFELTGSVQKRADRRIPPLGLGNIRFARVSRTMRPLTSLFASPRVELTALRMGTPSEAKNPGEMTRSCSAEGPLLGMDNDRPAEI